MTDPQSKSKVGRRLTGETAREVCELIYAPRLAREFGRGFAALTDINQAHLLMLHRAGLVAGEPAARIARALVRIEEEGPDAFDISRIKPANRPRLQHPAVADDEGGGTQRQLSFLRQLPDGFEGLAHDPL